MTEEFERQLREVLTIEGFPTGEIEWVIVRTRHDAVSAMKWERFLRAWRLVTETKQ